MKKKILAVAAAVGPALAAFAEGESADPVASAVSELQSLGEGAATSIAPMVTAVAIAFAGITLAIVAVRYFRRAAR